MNSTILSALSTGDTRALGEALRPAMQSGTVPRDRARSGSCRDCGCALRTGIEEIDRLCYCCVRERTGA